MDDSKDEKQTWEAPRLVGHGLLSDITHGAGAGAEDFLGDSGTATPS